MTNEGLRVLPASNKALDRRLRIPPPLQRFSIKLPPPNRRDYRQRRQGQGRRYGGPRAFREDEQPTRAILGMPMQWRTRNPHSGMLCCMCRGTCDIQVYPVGRAVQSLRRMGTKAYTADGGIEFTCRGVSNAQNRGGKRRKGQKKGSQPNRD